MVDPVRASLKRQAAYALGLEAETIAAKLLVAQGFTIAETRYRSSSGEVDLIARANETIVFVEVKARRSVGAALDSVSRAAQRRIEAAGQDWIADQPDGHLLSWRNDVIAVVPGHPPFHFEDVW